MKDPVKEKNSRVAFVGIISVQYLKMVLISGIPLPQAVKNRKILIYVYSSSFKNIFSYVPYGANMRTKQAASEAKIRAHKT